MIARRPMLAGLGLALLGRPALANTGMHEMQQAAAPFGMIGRIKAQPGKRGALLEVLGAGTAAMPGCVAYLIAEDVADADAIWITEIWDGQESHAASLKLPQVRDAIAKGRPLIADFDLSVETRPVPGASFPRQG